MVQKLIAFSALLAILGGCTGIQGMLPDSVQVHYKPGDSLPDLAKVHRTGDFAIYYGDDKTPQMPVRVHAGEKIGFIRGSDGAIKAVAGDFRMNVSNDVAHAHWKRLNYLDD